MDKNKILIIAFVLGCSLVFAQKNTIKVYQDSTTWVFSTTDKQPKILQPMLEYCWFKSMKVHVTQGGFSGKVLDGEATEYYKNGNLKAKGKFVVGLKQGVWTYWYPNGKLKYSINFRRGFPKGKLLLNENDGSPLIQGNLNGKGELVLRQELDSIAKTRILQVQEIDNISVVERKKCRLFKRSRRQQESYPGIKEEESSEDN